jgi:hypothetical protein
MNVAADIVNVMAASDLAIDWPHSTIHRSVARGLLPANWVGASPEGDFDEW